jgi:hypothetical protein
MNFMKRHQKIPWTSNNNMSNYNTSDIYVLNFHIWITIIKLCVTDQAGI